MKSKKTKHVFGRALAYFLVTLLGLIMLYPIIWMLFSSVKPNGEVLTSTKLLPSEWHWENFAYGWKMVRPYTFTLFFKNTFILVLSCVLASMLISLLAGYAFARIDFSFKPFWYSVLFVTIMLPAVTTLVARYVIFNEFGWLNTYLPFIIPSILGVGVGGGFFIYLIAQFIRGIPYELDEAANIDGCSTLGIIFRIILPLCKPAMFSVAIFAFMWNWDDFQNQLIYLTRVERYTVALAMRTTIDSTGADNWGAVLSMALCSVIPMIIIFFTLQQYFVEGVSTSGLKG